MRKLFCLFLSIIFGLCSLSLSAYSQTVPLANQQPTNSDVRLLQHQESPAANHAVLLLYHHVANDTPAITSISPDNFEQQLQYLEDQQFTVWPLPKIIRFLKAQQPLPDKTVAITFDDNYRSVYTEAYPRLKKRNWPFTIFVSTEAADAGFKLQSSWEEVRTMAANGATIANHSASHDHLLYRHTGETDQQWRARITHDITSAQQLIEAETGQRHKLFAYPYGEFDHALVTLVTSLGYVGIGQHSGVTSTDNYQQAAPRFAFTGRYVERSDFALKVMSLPLAVEVLKAPENPLNHQLARPELSFRLRDPNLSTQNLQCFGSLQGKLDVARQSQPPNTIRVIPGRDIPVGRSRYNCTLPAKNGRYYWFTYPWIRLDKNNRWILD
jgi:peptidoglycan/xylan/chitin deacetylase (PgdA/CDA1 family)